MPTPPTPPTPDAPSPIPTDEQISEAVRHLCDTPDFRTVCAAAARVPVMRAALVKVRDWLRTNRVGETPELDALLREVDAAVGESE
jgi:hypothetical protein